MTPANPTTLLGLLSHVPDDQTAIIQPEQNIRITYGNLKHQVQDVAEALTAAGISPSDRVGMAWPNGLANVVTFLAASMAGTAAPLNPAYKGRRELLAYCKEKLSDFKRPKQIHIVDAMPRTATGKVQQRVVAQAFAQQVP